jgi:hypothetical protein
MIRLDLERDEFIALVALIGCGMNNYLRKPAGRHMDALDRTEKPVIDSLTEKLNARLEELLAQMREPE